MQLKKEAKASFFTSVQNPLTIAYPLLLAIHFFTSRLLGTPAYI